MLGSFINNVDMEWLGDYISLAYVVKGFNKGDEAQNAQKLNTWFIDDPKNRLILSVLKK